MNWIKYLLEANLYLALFYLAYYLLLRRETYYQLNRAYLLGSSLLAFIIPLLQLGFLKPAPVLAKVVEATDTVMSASFVAQSGGQMPAPVPTEQLNYYLLIYIIIAAVLAIGFGFRIFQLIKLSKSGKRTIVNDFKIIEIEEDEGAFSFFNYLFVGKKLTASDTVIRHEMIHIQQRHSLDIIYLELLKIICWFNPFVYLLQQGIKELHEFIADSYVSATGQDVDAYTDFLISNAYGLPETALTNNFFNKNLLKTRIMMLHQKRSGSLARLKYLVALPLLTGMLCLSTLGFTKDYTMIDLAPGHPAVDDPIKPMKSQHKAPPAPPIPPAPKIRSVTSKGYKYEEDGYLVNGKTNFRVIITEKDGEQKEYLKNTATRADLNLLSSKYGYTFPAIRLHAKMPPSPPMAPDTNTTQRPMPPRPKVKQMGTPPKPKVDPIPAQHKPKVTQIGTPPKPKVDPRPAPPKPRVAPMPPKPKVDPIKKNVTQGNYTTFYQELIKNTRYPAVARDKNIQGKVFVAFDINNDNKIQNIRILRSPGDVLSDEIVGALTRTKTSGNFEQNITYTLPIDFSLSGVNSEGPMQTDKNTTSHYKETRGPHHDKEIDLKEIEIAASK